MHSLGAASPCESRPARRPFFRVLPCRGAFPTLRSARPTGFFDRVLVPAVACLCADPEASPRPRLRAQCSHT